MQVLFAAMLIDTAHTALEDRKEAFNLYYGALLYPAKIRSARQ